MGTKTISVTSEVYGELASRKKPSESFSEELMRLMNGGSRLSDCAGLWSWMGKGDFESIGKGIEKRRQLSREAKKERVLQ